MSTPEYSDASPLHGFQGDRRPLPAGGPGPRGLAIALSREAGGRGGSIANRVGKKLGWQVYHQELLDFLAQDAAVRDGLLAGLQPADIDWIDRRLQERVQSAPPAVLDQARLILALGMAGNVVLVGRGGGCLLPPATTLNVRVIAPKADRIAYLSQKLRLTQDEAAEQVEMRDRRRSEFIQTHYGRQPSDPYQYDLLINSSLLGEELCVELIVQAVKAKQSARERPGHAAPPWEVENVQ